MSAPSIDGYSIEKYEIHWLSRKDAVTFCSGHYFFTRSDPARGCAITCLMNLVCFLHNIHELVCFNVCLMGMLPFLEMLNVISWDLCLFEDGAPCTRTKLLSSSTRQRCESMSRGKSCTGYCKFLGLVYQQRVTTVGWGEREKIRPSQQARV